jgi:adenylyltransferase/sulfurtransferase
LHRQILFTAAEVGAPKALVAAARLRLHNPAVEITTHEGDFTAGNARALVAGQTVVLDCTDNFATRFVLHDACRSLNVPLVQAAVHRFEGTLDVFRHDGGGCLHCLAAGRGPAELDAAGNCAGGPVFGPAVGVLGVMQAAEALKVLLGLGSAAAAQTRLVNLLDGSQLAIARTARADCPVCGAVEHLAPISMALAGDGTPVLLDDAQIAALGRTVQRVFLVEPGSAARSSGRPATLDVAVSDLARLRELAAAGPVVLQCQHGIRSAALARLLRAEGLAHVFARTAGRDG